MLLDKPQSSNKPLPLRRSEEGKYGRLLAVIKDVRETAHSGDLVHQIYPSCPRVNDIFVLGEGTLFFSGDRVGIVPGDGRATLWLDIRALHWVHNQTVTLIFDDGKAVR